MLGPLNTVRDAAGAKAVRNGDELSRRAPLMLVATGEPFDIRIPTGAGPSN